VEYRLSVPSLITSILAMVFAGIANSLRRAALQRYATDYPNHNEEYYWLLGAGYCITVTWILFFWKDRNIVLRDLNHVPFIFIVVNIVATTIALLVGRSTVFPMDVYLLEDGPNNDKAPSLCDYDTFALMMLAGIAGCSTTILIRRSYTNWVQYCCFALAIVSGGLQPTLAIERTRTKCQVKDSLTYELLEHRSSTSADDEEADRVVDDMDTGEATLARSPDSWVSI
jgi:hypothetical protein